MWHRLQCVEVHVFGWHFNAASPPHGPKKVLAVWVGYLGTIDNQFVVVKAFIQLASVAGPIALVVFGEFAAVTKRAGDARGSNADESEDGQ